MCLCPLQLAAGSSHGPSYPELGGKHLPAMALRHSLLTRGRRPSLALSIAPIRSESGMEAWVSLFALGCASDNAGSSVVGSVSSSVKWDQHAVVWWPASHLLAYSLSRFGLVVNNSEGDRMAINNHTTDTLCLLLIF